MRTLPDTEVDKLRIKRDIVTNVPEVDCFTYSMQEFYAVCYSLKKYRYNIRTQCISLSD